MALIGFSYSTHVVFCCSYSHIFINNNCAQQNATEDKMLKLGLTSFIMHPFTHYGKEAMMLFVGDKE